MTPREAPLDSGISSWYSVRTRVTLWCVTVLAFALLAMGLMFLYVVHRNLRAAVDEELVARARGFQHGWSHAPNQRMKPPNREAAPADKEEQTFRRFRPRAFDAQTRPYFAGTTDEPWSRTEIARAMRSTAPCLATIQYEHEPYRLVSVQVNRPGYAPGVVQMVMPLTQVESDLRGLSRTLLTLIPVALLVTGLGAAFLARRLLLPVRLITETAASIEASDLSKRLPVSGRDEFARLAHTFNMVLERLEQAFAQQRQFTADASHELRTPLTAIKAQASLALQDGNRTPADRKAFERIDHAANLMTRIVEDLMLLARADAGELRIDRRNVRTVDLFEAAMEAIPAGDHASICPTVEPADLMLSGDPAHLTRLIANLLSNAVRHTPSDGCIGLSARFEGALVVLSICDNGSGIAPEHLVHLGRRFYRADSARSRKQGGTGLGLAICRSIAEAHGGRMEIESVLGSGTTVRVLLPVSLSA